MLPGSYYRNPEDSNASPKESATITTTMIIYELAAGIGYNFRRFWVDERSHHWITHVLNGNLLRDKRFEKTFRMSRKSFELLHGLLGTCYYPVLLTHM